MVKCKVKIVEAFNLDSYPGWCRAVLKDADGSEHILVDKLPVMGIEHEEVSNIPFETYIYVSIINDFGDVVEISTEIPDGIETEEGKNRFMVLKNELN